MKKHYIAPELEKIIFGVEDIITHSLATEGSDNVIDASDLDSSEYDDWFGGATKGTFNVDMNGDTWYN